MGTIYKNLGFENITDSFGFGIKLRGFFKTGASRFGSESRANPDLESSQDRTSLPP